MKNESDIFPSSMLDLIQNFGAQCELESEFEEVDLFAFKYSDEEMLFELNEGIDANYDDFVSGQNSLTFDGHNVIVYIKIQDSFANLKKYHFTNCPVVSQNVSSDAYDAKFVMTTRNDGNFKVFDLYGNEKQAKLEPCGHCCNSLGIKKSASVAEIFKFIENSNIGKKKIKKNPKHNHNSVISKHVLQGYVPNWPGISKMIRRQRGFACEICKVDLSSKLSLLHVHHKNRDKKDNTDDNLHVLCVECHSGQKDHEHMKDRFNFQIKQVIRMRNAQNKLNRIWAI